MAKTQYSLPDDPTLLGRPEGFGDNDALRGLCEGAAWLSSARAVRCVQGPGTYSPRHG